MSQQMTRIGMVGVDEIIVIIVIIIIKEMRSGTMGIRWFAASRRCFRFGRVGMGRCVERVKGPASRKKATLPTFASARGAGLLRFG